MKLHFIPLLAVALGGAAFFFSPPGMVRAEPGPAGNSSHRQYAPNRQADILHLALDVTPDFDRRSIRGTAVIRFKPIAFALPELRLDAVDLEVQEVTATVPVRGWQATREQLVVTFAEAVPADEETVLTVRYQAAPEEGLYFRTPAMGYPATDTHLWTQGEAISARHWYPSHDAPNEKFTSEVTCRVPRGMTVLSNGRLVSEADDAGSDRVAFRWVQDKPHVNYLISLVAGYFEGIQDRHGEIPLGFYTTPSHRAWASNSFAGTRDMMAWFEAEIGVPYPWAKYHQVCVADFVVSGMENTSLTTLTDRTLFPPEWENLRTSQGLVAHELAHQWFGDLVTCKDWAHIWLNEGFATYYEKLYDGHRHGQDLFRYRMHQTAQGIVNRSQDTNAIVRRNFRDPGEQFSYLTYPKGAWVLHMLRCQLGEDLFRRCVKTFLERHAYGTAVTEDLVRVFEELSGLSLDQFFDQWVYHAHHPELTVRYDWTERDRLARLTIQQTQKLGPNVLLFRVPLTVRFKGPFGTVDRELIVHQDREDFYVPLPAQPDIVRVDPELALLAKISFQPSAAMLQAQLSDPTDILGRLLAVEQSGSRKDDATVARLGEVLRTDPFFGVRAAASKVLRKIGTEPARAALQAGTDQPDARVRRQVIDDLTSFYRPETVALALETLQTEKNPLIQAEAVRALGPYPQPDVQATLTGCLSSNSFRNVLANAAIDAMRAQDDPVYVAPVLAFLNTCATLLDAHDFGRALDALAWLARNQEEKGAVRDFLLGQVNHATSRIQSGALAALGTLGDPQAVAALQTFTEGDPDSRVTQAARTAVASLQAARKPPAEAVALRKELQELEQANRELRETLEQLKKRLDALSPEKSGAPPAAGTDE